MNVFLRRGEKQVSFKGGSNYILSYQNKDHLIRSLDFHSRLFSETIEREDCILYIRNTEGTRFRNCCSPKK